MQMRTSTHKSSRDKVKYLAPYNVVVIYVNLCLVDGGLTPWLRIWRDILVMERVVYGPDRPPVHPPRNVWDLFYFVLGTCLNMKSGCHHHQIGMDYLWDAIFKMAAIEISGIIFSPVTQFLR